MKFKTNRRASGQSIIEGAGALILFLPIFGVLFAALYNISTMLIYTERLAFLAGISVFHYARGAGAGMNPADSGNQGAEVAKLHLPNGTAISWSGPANIMQPVAYTAQASCPYHAMGFWNVTLTDSESAVPRPY